MGNSPEICLGLTEDDLKKKTPDYDAEIKKGLTPHLVCGISTEGASSAPSPSQDDDAPRKMPNGDPVFCREPEAHLFIPQWCHTEILDSCDGLPGKYALNLDHDHETGKFRGWLCSRCNRGLGLLGDSRKAILRAARYLRKADGQ